MFDDGRALHRRWPSEASLGIWEDFRNESLRPLPTLLGLVLVTMVGLGGRFRPLYVTDSHIVLTYLLIVLILAVRFGLWPALITAVASIASLDFFFFPPLYSFFVYSRRDALLLAFFGVIAVTVSSLASRLRKQMLVAQRHANTTNELYLTAARLAGAVTINAMIDTIVTEVADLLQCRASISLSGDGMAGTTGLALGQSPIAQSSATGLTLPMRVAGKSIGIMTVIPPEGEVITGPARHFCDALAELAGLALGRQLLADNLARLGIEQEADRLRSALLNSIAHDLTAPISAVASALGSLKDGYECYDDETRREIIVEADREAQRLHRFSAKLLDMTRLENDAIQLRLERVDLGDLVGSAMGRARHLLEPRRILYDIPAGLPWPSLDFVLMEQTIFNLLENAAKYTKDTSTITIKAEGMRAGVMLQIKDDGPGFPVDDSERIFSKFYRASLGSAHPHGTGLGLAIARGFVEAHGGTITAANRADGTGAIFTITLPIDAAIKNQGK